MAVLTGLKERCRGEENRISLAINPVYSDSYGSGGRGEERAKAIFNDIKNILMLRGNNRLFSLTLCDVSPPQFEILQGRYMQLKNAYFDKLLQKNFAIN